MMSEEITKVMDEQRDLELEYAQLVQQRDQLKGISNKQLLMETKENIMVTVSEFKFLKVLNITDIFYLIESCQGVERVHSQTLPTVTKEARRRRQPKRSQAP